MQARVLAVVLALLLLPAPALAPGGTDAVAVPALDAGAVDVGPLPASADGLHRVMLEFRDAPSEEALARLRALDPGLRVLRIVPVVALTLRGDELADALRVPGLLAAWPDAEVVVAADSAVPAMGGDAARATHGVDGAGVVVAFVDTGVDAAHPALAGKVLAFRDLLQGLEDAYDDHGHGTHVVSLAIGGPDGMPGPGVAPGARAVVVKAVDSFGRSTESRVLEGIEWIVEHRDVHGSRVLSLSVVTATNSDGRTPLERGVDAAAEAGLLVVAAAGNSGSAAASVRSPATARGALAVGATDDAGLVQPWSSRGPTRDGRAKPDLVAPGLDVRGADAGGGVAGGSGTSLSTPLVAGLAALMVEAAPTLDRDGLAAALVATAEDRGPAGPDAAYGHGVVRAAVAVGEAVAAAEGVAVRAVRPPAWTPAGVEADVVARVVNAGAAPASTVVRLEADGVEVASAAVALAPAERRDVALPILPEADGNVSLVVRVDALAGEARLDDNAVEATLVVRTPARTLRVAVVDSPGTDFAWMFAWDVLEDGWWLLGDTAVEFDLDALAHGVLTLDDFLGSEVDVLVLPDLCCEALGHRLDVDEVDAVLERAAHGRAVVGTFRTLVENPALGPAFGVAMSPGSNSYPSEWVAYLPTSPIGEGAPVPMRQGAALAVAGASLQGAELHAVSRVGAPAAWVNRQLPGAGVYLAYPGEVVGFGAGPAEVRTFYNALLVAADGSALPDRNVALTRLRLTEWALPGETVHGLVRATNAGTSHETGEVEVCVANGACARVAYALAPGAWQDLPFAATVPAGASTREVVLRALADDPFPADDVVRKTLLVRDKGALIVQDVRPWGLPDQNRRLLLGARYGVDSATPAELPAIPLSRYAKIVLAGNQPASTWSALAAHEALLAAYVEAGGFLEVHATVLGDGGFSLLGFRQEGGGADDVRVLAPWHRALGRAERDLDGWGWTHRGVLAERPLRSAVVLDSVGGPVAVEAPRGDGVVLVTTLGLERWAAIGSVAVPGALAAYQPGPRAGLAIEATLPRALDPGVAAEVEVDVVNLAEEARAADVRLLADGVLVASAPVDLAPGARGTVRLPWTPQEGRRALQVETDALAPDWSNRASAEVAIGRPAWDEAVTAGAGWGAEGWTFVDGGAELAETTWGAYRLEMPLLDLALADAAVLEADVRFGGTYGSSILRLQASTGGATWRTLQPVLGPQHPDLGYGAGFTGTGAGTAVYDLSDYAGRAVRLRWVSVLLANDPAVEHAVGAVVVRATGPDPGFRILLANPPDLALLPAGLPVDIEAATTHQVERVEFWDGATLLGADATPPYRWTWTPGIGPHDLRAVAVRAEGGDEDAARVFAHPYLPWS